MSKLDASQKQPARKALGRGLRALISTPSITVEPVRPEQEKYTNRTGANALSSGNAALSKASETNDNVKYLDLALIENNPEQPRQIFNQLELEELSASIKALGVIQPILVRPGKSKGMYQVVAGERRWRAAKLAQLTQVPVIIKELDNKETLEIALVENIQRSNLSPTEEARAYQSLSDDFGLSQKEVSERVGKDRSTITNFVRLLKLPNEVLDLLDMAEISMGHAKAILSAREPAVQKNLARKCVAEKLSVREIEEIVARVVNLDSKKSTKKVGKAKSDFPEISDSLRKALGTKVSIKHDKKHKRGKIVIEYFSEEELDRLVELIA